MVYQPTRETHPIAEAMAVAAAVFRQYGFVKRGHGYNISDDVYVADSKTIVVNSLRPADQRGDPRIPVVVPTEEDRAHATLLRETFDQKVLLAKLSDNQSDFDKLLEKILGKDRVDVELDISIIASLPNSYIIQQRRDFMDSFFTEHKNNPQGFIGRKKERLKLEVDVKDVKWIPNRDLYLVTFATVADNKIGKFFLKQGDADLSERIRGNVITMTGTVRDQQLSDYTGCEETLFNRVKIS